MEAVTGPDLEWRELSRRASLQSHRLIGWIYWDPGATARYVDLGLPRDFAEPLGYTHEALIEVPLAAASVPARTMKPT